MTKIAFSNRKLEGETSPVLFTHSATRVPQKQKQSKRGIGVFKQPVVEGSIPKPPMTERKARPQKDQVLNCPRCNSTNTKFCYYNNCILSQPRYLCKTCRRYWTEAGSLRNVPVGGGYRKNKRSSSSSSSAISSKKLPDLNPKRQKGQHLN